MNYLPSKNFIKKAISVSLLMIGWFYFFGGNNQTTKINLASEKGSNWDLLSLLNGGQNAKNTKYAGEDSLTNDFANSAASETMSGKYIKISYSDIPTIETDSKTEILRYGKELALALKPYSNNTLPNEAILTLNSLQSKDSSGLKDVFFMGQLHNTIASNIRKIIVPQEFVLRHTNLLNNIKKLSYLDAIMTNAFQDPKAAVDAVVDFKKETTEFMNSIIDINDLFSEKGIMFSKEDKISIYVNGIQ